MIGLAFASGQLILLSIAGKFEQIVIESLAMPIFNSCFWNYYLIASARVQTLTLDVSKRKFETSTTSVFFNEMQIFVRVAVRF